MMIAQKMPTRRGPSAIQPVYARTLLRRYRRRTLLAWSIATALLGAALSWLAGAWNHPATTNWDALATWIFFCGIAGLFYRELWLIRWAARAGAPYPTYRDPWGRPLPDDREDS